MGGLRAGGWVPYHDYLAPGEGLEAARARLGEVLGPRSLEGRAIVCSEVDSAGCLAEGGEAGGGPAAAGVGAFSGGCSWVVLVASAAAVLAAALAWSAQGWGGA